MSGFVLNSRLTEPILLPQHATFSPFPLKKSTAISTYLASSHPKEMKSLSVRLPQPSKSKQASPTPAGNIFRCVNPSSLLELLPCRYSITQRMLGGVQTDRGNGMLKTSSQNFPNSLPLILSRCQLQSTRGGLTNMQLYFSMHPSAVYLLSSMVLGWAGRSPSSVFIYQVSRHSKIMIQIRDKT